MIDKKIRFFVFVFLLVISSCTKGPISLSEEVVEKKQLPFFVSAPIAKFSDAQLPIVDVEIDHKTFSMELDLGLRADLSLQSEYVNELPSREWVGSKPMYGLLGDEEQRNLYRIPRMKIGKISFVDLVLQERSPEFSESATFIPNGQEPSPEGPGSLGWELFYNSNLLLDFKNSQIAFSDSLLTLQEEGFPIESFTKAPLFLRRGLVEFDVTTPDGPLRCVLDTGATFNILNVELAEGKTIEEMVWDDESRREYPSFKISGKDFGPVEFTQIPIKIPIHVEAILGMEFIREHLIFIDFANRQIYLRAYE